MNKFDVCAGTSTDTNQKRGLKCVTDFNLFISDFWRTQSLWQFAI